MSDLPGAARVEIVRELREGKRQACLVKRGDEHFVVRPIAPPMDSADLPGWLVFASSSRGSVTDWCEVAGGPGVSREQAIAELEASPRRGWRR